MRKQALLGWGGGEQAVQCQTRSVIYHNQPTNFDLQTKDESKVHRISQLY